MRVFLAVLFVLGLAAPAVGQQGLTGALDRLETQRAVQQSETRRESQAQRQELQRQLDQSRLQQQTERQLMLRQTPVPCPFDRPAIGC